MTQAVEATDLDTRYGRTPQARRRRRWFGVGAAAAVVAVFAAWVVWATFDGTDHFLEAQEIGYTKVGDDQITVRWELTVDPGTEVRCGVQALDERYEVVGWQVVDIPASDELTRPMAHTIRVVAPATTGLISSCWLP